MQELKLKKNIQRVTKSVLKRRVGQSRKKGAILIELLAAIPVFIFLIWAIMNLMLYLLSSSQLNEAAYETSRAIAVEMRGHTEKGDIGEFATNVEDNIKLVTSGSAFIEIFQVGHEPVTAYNKLDCETLYTNDENNIICAYIEAYDGGSGKEHLQVIVSLRSDYNIVGGWMPWLEDNIMLNARSVAQVEISGRYNYVEY